MVTSRRRVSDFQAEPSGTSPEAVRKLRSTRVERAVCIFKCGRLLNAAGHARPESLVKIRSTATRSQHIANDPRKMSVAQNVTADKNVRFVGVDLFAGAGGMTLGAQRAGVEVLCCVENDSHARDTYRHNHPDIEMFETDIRQWQEFPRVPRGAVKILFGGAPCQGFSTSNQRTRGLKNDNNWLFMEFLRVAEKWKPDWIIFENVKGIAETEKGLFLKSILCEVADLGYTVVHDFLQASDFGVPQRRTRLFVVGSRHGVKAAMPKPNGTKSPTVWEAISDLPVLKNGAAVSLLPYRCAPKSAYQTLMRGDLAECANHLVSRNFDYVIERYRYIPQGGNWESVPDHLMRNYSNKHNCHTGIYRRLREDEPSVVIGNYRKNMLIHPRQDRGLSVREAARLQSFPDRFQFNGSIGFQQQQVGNAVPPLLAEKVMKAVIDSHLSDS